MEDLELDIFYKKSIKLYKFVNYRALFRWSKKPKVKPIVNKKLLEHVNKLTLLKFNNKSNNVIKSFNDVYYLQFIYRQFYMSNLLKLPIIFKNYNIKESIPQSLFSYMIYDVNSIKWKKYNISHSNEVVEILFLSLWVRNLKLFMIWMREYFEKQNLKKHKKLFLLFKALLGNFFWRYNIFFQLKGIRLILLGKFGKAGSVRKTRKYIKRGKCSYTSKNLALVNQTTVIRTITGVFSIKMEVFF